MPSITASACSHWCATVWPPARPHSAGEPDGAALGSPALNRSDQRKLYQKRRSAFRFNQLPGLPSTPDHGARKTRNEAVMNVTIVVGNPKARSRTYHAANLVAEKLTDRPADLVIDLADVGAALLDWTSGDVTGLVESVVSSDLVIFASPTFKG